MKFVRSACRVWPAAFKPILQTSCSCMPCLSQQPLHCRKQVVRIQDKKNLFESVASTDVHSDLLVEANRLATFKNWPNPNISPQSLAKAGFYYLNQSDQVKCAWCKGVMAEWEEHDNAFEEHKRFFPDCPRVQLGPLIEIASDGIRDLGIQHISPPKRPKFSSLDARLRTYDNWPINDIQQPEALAQAGLYYQDVDDQVRCFHCNIGLRSWQKDDDPWFEHAKWYPQCQFVRLVKGINYVEYVHELTRQSAQRAQPQFPTAPSMTIEEAMSTPPVLQALEIGIDGGSLRNATQLQLSATGRPYDIVEDLLKAVFGDPDDVEPTSSSSNSSPGASNAVGESIVRDVSRLIFSTTDISTDKPNSFIPLASNTCQQNLEAPSVPRGAQHITPTYLAINDTSISMQHTNSILHNNPNPNIIDVTSSALEPINSTMQPATADTVQQKEMTSRSILSPKSSLSLEEENRQLKDARLCKVCLDEEVGVVFLPCGHLVTCVQCAPGVNQCPMCRTSIKGFVRTFLS